MNIVAFAASSSSKSINKKLVTYAAGLLTDASVEVLDLNDFELPIFSEDKEAELGQPELAKQFFAKFSDCDGVIISFAEHNGSYSAAYKNLFDWCSRIDTKVYQNKPMVLLSTSPGPGGAARVLSQAIDSMPHFGGIVKSSFSVSSFYDNFDDKSNKINDVALDEQLRKEVAKIRS